MPAETHLAVTAETNRINPHSFDHRLPVTDGCTVFSEFRLAITDYCNVGCGTTHIGDNSVFQTTQFTGANDASGRARQYRTNRLFDRIRHARE